MSQRDHVIVDGLELHRPAHAGLAVEVDAELADGLLGQLGGGGDFGMGQKAG